MNRAISLIFENMTMTDRKILREMSDFEKSGMLGNSVHKLYASLLNKSRSDFDAIDNCKGDIKKYVGYENMLKCLDALSDMGKTVRGVGDMKEVNVVRQAISNIERHTEAFKTSYKLERDFGILAFRTIVAACVESTSIIISSAIEFLKDSQAHTVKLISNYETKDHLPIHQLEKFNASVSSGEFNRVMTHINTTDKEKLVGAVALPFVIIGAVVAIVIILRELIFYFYYSRMLLSQYLDQQKDFLEYNVTALEYDKTMDTSKKSNVIKKQKDIIKRLEKVSDKIRVNNSLTAVQTRDAVKKEKESFSLSAAPKTNNGDGETFTLTSGFKIL